MVFFDDAKARADNRLRDARAVRPYLESPVAEVSQGEKSLDPSFEISQMERNQPSFSSVLAAESVNRRAARGTTANAPRQSAEVTALSQVEETIAKVVAASFPQLQGRRFRINIIHTNGVFFQSQPDVATWLNPFAKRAYVIDVNPALFNASMSESALRGVVAHELAHASHYERGGIWAVVVAGVSQFFRGMRRDYEHRTDWDAVDKGYGQDLINFRRWLYEHVDDETLRMKKDVYLTPSEIQAHLQGTDK